MSMIDITTFSYHCCGLAVSKSMDHGAVLDLSLISEPLMHFKIFHILFIICIYNVLDLSNIMDSLTVLDFKTWDLYLYKSII